MAATVLRDYGVGAQILLDLGVRDMIVMSSTRPNPAGAGRLRPAHRRLA
jgi:GTP cyclohydrolase II